jgi:hypothetical protein
VPPRRGVTRRAGRRALAVFFVFVDLEADRDFADEFDRRVGAGRLRAATFFGFRARGTVLLAVFRFAAAFEDLFPAVLRFAAGVLACALVPALRFAGIAFFFPLLRVLFFLAIDSPLLVVAGPHPRSRTLGGALRALHSVASREPQSHAYSLQSVFDQYPLTVVSSIAYRKSSALRQAQGAPSIVEGRSKNTARRS